MAGFGCLHSPPWETYLLIIIAYLVENFKLLWHLINLFSGHKIIYWYFLNTPLMKGMITLYCSVQSNQSASYAHLWCGKNHSPLSSFWPRVFYFDLFMQWCSYFDLLVFCVKTKDKIKGEVNFCQNQLQIRINPKSTGLYRTDSLCYVLQHLQIWKLNSDKWHHHQNNGKM